MRGRDGRDGGKERRMREEGGKKRKEGYYMTVLQMKYE
jgi:hypothetical protein